VLPIPIATRPVFDGHDLAVESPGRAVDYPMPAKGHPWGWADAKFVAIWTEKMPSDMSGPDAMSRELANSSITAGQ